MPSAPVKGAAVQRNPRAQQQQQHRMPMPGLKARPAAEAETSELKHLPKVKSTNKAEKKKQATKNLKKNPPQIEGIYKYRYVSLALIVLWKIG